ncbi:MAG: xylulokinase [Mycobacteriales bacterium]
MPLVAGVDCSTQSTKVVVCDADTGAILREGKASHPDTSEIDPEIWWRAFLAASDGILDGVEAIAVGGQQHGMVLLEAHGAVVRDALLWNDTCSAAAATALVDERGGPDAWAAATGSVPLASFTVTKLRWVADHEPETVRRTAAVALPHDWLTARLRAGGGPVDISALTTDRGDASGTGYWSPADGSYRADLLAAAARRELAVPRVADPAEAVGTTPDGAVPAGIALAAGTGDNMAAALGLGLAPGDVAISLGTSGTVFAVADAPTADPSGLVAGFADATGRFLPLVCTLNAARVLDAAAALLGLDIAAFDRLAAEAPHGDGLVVLPYLDGERTPDLPAATGLAYGLTRATSTPAHYARAATEGMLCGLADGLDALRAQGVVTRRAVLIGGAARSAAVQALAPALFGVPLAVPEPGEYVARGAARQAAWILRGGAEPPDWPVASTDLPQASLDGATRTAYAQVRDAALPLLRKDF